jgi:hypothetical protein
MSDDWKKTNPVYQKMQVLNARMKDVVDGKYRCLIVSSQPDADEATQNAHAQWRRDNIELRT